MFKKNKLNKLSISLGLGVILTMVTGLNSAAFAQSGNDNEGYQSNEKSTLFGGSSGDLNPFELMHSLQQKNRRSDAEFNEESQGQLDNSAADFKRLQQQRILEQRRNSAETSTDVPELTE